MPNLVKKSNEINQKINQKQTKFGRQTAKCQIIFSSKIDQYQKKFG